MVDKHFYSNPRHWESVTSHCVNFNNSRSSLDYMHIASYTCQTVKSWLLLFLRSKGWRNNWDCLLSRAARAWQWKHSHNVLPDLNTASVVKHLSMFIQWKNKQTNKKGKKYPAGFLGFCLIPEIMSIPKIIQNVIRLIWPKKLHFALPLVQSNLGYLTACCSENQ